MSKWKYWITLFGWKLNAWLHASGLDSLPLVGRMLFTGKRVMAGWLASGRGVPVRLAGWPTYVHPLSIAYGIQSWEPYTSELFQSALKPGSTVLDIGAHHGYFSLLAARCVGKEGKVYAFEPVPQNFQILKKNIELNHLTNVFPVNKAVSDRCTTAPFYFRSDIGTGGSLFQTNRTNESSVFIECITIDEFLGGETVDVVKMDIEGFEPYALDGMKETLRQAKNIVLFLELAPYHLNRAGVSPEDFLAQLDKAGLACQFVNEERRCLQPTNSKLIPEEGFGRRYCNLYCVKKVTVD